MFSDAPVLNCSRAKQAWHVQMVMVRLSEGSLFSLKISSTVNTNVYTSYEALVMNKLNGP